MTAQCVRCGEAVGKAVKKGGQISPKRTERGIDKERLEKVCRLCEMDEKLTKRNEAVDERLDEMQRGLEDVKREIERVEKRLDEAIKECKNASELKVQEALKEIAKQAEYVASTVQEIRNEKEGQEERIERLEWAVDGCSKMESPEQVVIRTKEGTTEAVGSGKTKVQRKNEARPKAIPQKEKLVVLGDSIARGIGERLKEQHGNVKVLAKGGSLIGDTAKIAERTEWSGSEQVIVMTGGNNIERWDYSEEIMEGYAEILRKLKEKGVNNITMVGLSTRRCFKSIQTSRAIGLSERLSRLCAREGARYVDGGVEEAQKNRMLAVDGVHFSREWEDVVVRRIYSSIRENLNLLGTVTAVVK